MINFIITIAEPENLQFERQLGCQTIKIKICLTLYDVSYN